jgi:hypothetical protein
MVGRLGTPDSVGETPTDATGTAALPEKSIMIRVNAVLDAETLRFGWCFLCFQLC